MKGCVVLFPALFLALLTVALQIVKDAVWTISNLIGDNDTFRDMYIHRDIVTLFSEMVTRSPPPCTTTVTNITRALSLTSGAVSLLTNDHVDSLKRVVDRWIDVPDTNIDVCVIISNICLRDEADRIFFNRRTVLTLLRFLSDEQVRRYALHTIGYLAFGSDEQTQVLIDAGVLAYLEVFLVGDDVRCFVACCSGRVLTAAAGPLRRGVDRDEHLCRDDRPEGGAVRCQHRPGHVEGCEGMYAWCVCIYVFVL